jgi:LysR family hydrogen peroxide-inducible transcriptional activator
VTIAQLEYLLAVVNCGSFSAAARHCSLTQPSLSIQIQNLEDELGIPLLDRSARPITPTESGRAVIEQATTTIAEFYAMKEKVNQLKGELSGNLRLGVVPTVSPYLMPRFIPEFVKRCPDVQIEIRDMFPLEILSALNRDLLDIAILTGGDAPDYLREVKLFDEPLFAYVAPEHPLYNREVIYHDDIDMRSFLILSEGICLCKRRDGVCEARKKLKTQYNFANTSLETLMNTVDATGSITLIPRMVADFVADEKRDRIKTFGERDAYRTITMAVGRTCVKNALIDAVRECVLSVSDLSG